MYVWQSDQQRRQSWSWQNITSQQSEHHLARWSSRDQVQWQTSTMSGETNLGRSHSFVIYTRNNYISNISTFNNEFIQHRASESLQKIFWEFNKISTMSLETNLHRSQFCNVPRKPRYLWYVTFQHSFKHHNLHLSLLKIFWEFIQILIIEKHS